MRKRMRVLSLPMDHISGICPPLSRGCVASKKDQFMGDMMAKGVEPLSAAELTKLYSGATEYNKTKRDEFEAQYFADGTRKGRLWWPGGENSDEGEWRVTDDNLLCLKWLGKRSKSGKRCWPVYPATGENNYTAVQKSGLKSKGNPDGIVTVKITPGMQYFATCEFAN